MKNKHKYFKKLRYKQKLESKYRNYNPNIYFYTDVPCPDQYKKHIYYRYYNWIPIEKADKNTITGQYIYDERPTVPYSIREWTDRPYGKSKKFYKKYTTRVVRHSKDVLQHNQYRKMFDLWWTID